MTVIRSAHGRTLLRLINERRQALLESLVGNPTERTCGMIQGLDEALKLSEEADYNVNGEQ